MKRNLIPVLLKSRRITPDVITQYCKSGLLLFYSFLSPFFLTPTLKFILYMHLATALLVWTTAASSTSTSPLCCCKKKARTWLAIWVQSRRRRSLWTTPTLWSGCCSSFPHCAAAGSWQTVSALPYRRSAHWRRAQIMRVKVQCVKCGDLRKKERHQVVLDF